MSKIGGKTVTIEEKIEIVNLINTTDFKDCEIAEKLEGKGINRSARTVYRVRKDLPQIEKEIEEYKESKSVVKDDTESHQLEIAKEVIHQQNENIKRLTRKTFTLDDIRSVDEYMKDFKVDTLINMIFKRYKHNPEQVKVVFDAIGIYEVNGSLKYDRDVRNAFGRLMDEFVELNAKFKSQSSITENKVLNPIDNQRIEELEQRIEDLTAIVKAKDNMIKDLHSKIEELKSETPNKDVLLQQKDQIIEKLTKELAKEKKNYDDLVANNKDRDLKLIEMNTEIGELNAEIKELKKGKTHFKSSSKSKRKSKTTNQRGQQTTLGELK